MIIADNFVFLHQLRTGGTFLRYVLRDNGVQFRRAEQKHEAWRELPDEDKQKPVIIFVRNPWEWYVSWYSFENQVIPGENDWACGTFEEFVHRVESHQGYFEFFTHGVPEAQLHVGRHELLRQEAARIFEAVGCPNIERVKRRLKYAPPVHSSVHAPYHGYYTPELRDYVLERNRALIERFGYLFEAETAAAG